jgi:hypothetical protein
MAPEALPAQDFAFFCYPEPSGQGFFGFLFWHII